MKKYITPLLCCAALFSMLAETSVANDSGFAVGLGTQVQYFDYEEFNANGRSLNQEQGGLPGLYFFGRYTHNHLQHQLAATLFAGNVDYDGQTQTGIAHQTTTNTLLYSLSYRLEADILPERLAAYFSANWDYWSRSIQPSGAIIGLDETYRWPSLALGLKLPLISTGKHAVHVSSAYLHILKGKFTVDLSALGFGEPALDLGTGNGFESTLSYTLKLLHDRKAGIDLYYRQWRFAESDPKTINNGTNSLTFLEPRSKSKRIGLTFWFAVPF